MFSGIVEAQGRVLNAAPRNEVMSVQIERPTLFDDLACGDSISTNGVCLTIEAFDERQMTFAVGPETLRVTGWTEQKWLDPKFPPLNLERSLRLSDRIHGHLVQGHVDGVGRVVSLDRSGETLEMVVAIEASTFPAGLFWKKGACAINGVSLTINSIEIDSNEIDGSERLSRPNAIHLKFCLVPETLRRTNLGLIKISDLVNVEADMMARAIFAQLQAQQEQRESEKGKK